MADRCIFCDYEGDDFDPEHWIPQWLSRALEGKHKGIVHNLPGRAQFTSNKFEMTVKHVCKACNGGWMSDIETRAKAHVLPMIVGDYTKHLSKQGFSEVVRWCYLKVLSLEIGRPDDQEATHAREVFRAFKDSKAPPRTGCAIALGVRSITDANPEFVIHHSGAYSVGSGAPLEPRFHWYVTTLVVGHLAIQVVGLRRTDDLDVEPAPGFQVAWPIGPGWTFTWPPSQRLSG